MTSKERVLTALHRGQPDKVPFVEIRVDPSLQEAILGRPLREVPVHIGGLTNLCNPEVNEALGLDNLQVRFLPPIFADFGGAGHGDYPLRPWIRSRSDLDKMVFPDPDDPGLYRDAEARIQAAGGRYAVGATLRSGISAVHMSMGLDGLAYALADAPGLVETVHGRYTDWSIAVVRRLRGLGVDFVWTADDMAGTNGPFFSPDLFRRAFMPFLRRFAGAVREEGLPWILHSDGNVLPLIEDLLDVGIDALHPIEPGAMDIAGVRRRFGSRLALVGNVDLRYTLTRGTPEDVEREVRERIEVVGQGGGYLIGSANSLTDYCKVENVKAMAEAVRRYRDYPLRAGAA